VSSLGAVLVALPVLVGLHAYIFYPLTLYVGARIAGTRKRLRRAPSELPLPTVSVVIPAYNEEAQIRGSIESLLAQDYPADRLQILVLSDASTDRTDEIVREFAPRGVELFRMPMRSGKTAAENASCSVLRGEIVVNSDSSIRLHPSAVRSLVTRMQDRLVGVASGRDVSIAHQSGANVTEAGYVGYEMWVRGLETQLGGIVGASGSGYAIRADLHRLPVRSDLSRDFSAALTARNHGFQAVSVDDALFFVPRTSSIRREYKRKVRTISRGVETLISQHQLLDPIQHGLFAWKLISHKVCRWLFPVLAIPGTIGLALLSPDHWWARMGLGGIAIAGLLALVGLYWPSVKPAPYVISVAAFGMAANVAVIHALWRVAFGHQDHIWEPTRREPASSPGHHLGANNASASP